MMMDISVKAGMSFFTGSWIELHKKCERGLSYVRIIYHVQ